MYQPPPGVVTRTYRADNEYTRDAASMAAAGWRVTDVRRAPDGAIIATYAPPVPPGQAGVPMASTGASGQRGLGAWLARQPSSVRTGIVIGVVAMLLICGLVAMALDGNMQSQTVTIGVGDSPTATMAPTATPAPSPVSGPYLGGTLGDFDTAFGQEQGNGVWYTTLGGQSVMLTVQSSASTTGGSDSITTPDGLDRVWTVSISYLGPTPPTTAQNAAICRQFMPRDAQHVADNANAPLTPEHIYRSQQLAASFDANAFQNNAGSAVAPGTFDVVYGKRTCDMATGQN